MKIILRGMQYVFVALTVVLGIGSAYSQTPGTGAISGVVLDPVARVVANAEVTVISQETHASRSVRSITRPTEKPRPATKTGLSLHGGVNLIHGPFHHGKARGFNQAQ